MSFWCFQFFPKNERKQVDLRYLNSKVEFLLSFLVEIEDIKNPFKIIWPLRPLHNFHVEPPLKCFVWWTIWFASLWSFRWLIYLDEFVTGWSPNSSCFDANWNHIEIPRHWRILLCLIFFRRLGYSPCLLRKKFSVKRI